MITKLWPTVQHQAGESPQSFLSRLAAINGATARGLCRDIGLKFQDIVDGCESALTRLATLAQAALAPLMDCAIRKIDAGYEYQGQLLSRTELKRSRVMVCPMCISDDIDGATANPEFHIYGRTLWLFEPLQTCAIHDVALVEAANITKPREAHDFVLNVRPTFADFSGILNNVRHREPSKLEAYLQGRFGRAMTPGDWLDQLPWHVAADVCSMLGAVALRGRNAGIGNFDDWDWYYAGEAGYPIASGGEAAIAAFLTDVVRQPLDSKMPGGPQAQLGALFKWLSFGRDDVAYGPVRALFFRHAVETFPLAKGDVVYGFEVPERSIHSIYSASIEYNVHPKRLRKILFATGVVQAELESETNERITFKVEAGKDILKKAAHSINLTEAEDYLNAGRVHAKLLFEQGFITPFVVLPSKRKSEYNFAIDDLDAFLAQLLSNTVAVTDIGDDEFDIPSAAKRANCGAGEIVRLILDKKLGWVGRQVETSGFLSVLVRLAEVKAHVHRDARTGLTARELEHELRTCTKTVKALLAHAILPTEVIVNPINRCPTTVIKINAVREFQKTYVSLFNLAAERAIHFKALQNRLEGKGIVPALSREIYGASFYRRADLI